MLTNAYRSDSPHVNFSCMQEDLAVTLAMAVAVAAAAAVVLATFDDSWNGTASPHASSCAHSLNIWFALQQLTSSMCLWHSHSSF